MPGARARVRLAANFSFFLFFSFVAKHPYRKRALFFFHVSRFALEAASRPDICGSREGRKENPFSRSRRPFALEHDNSHEKDSRSWQSRQFSGRPRGKERGKKNASNPQSRILRASKLPRAVAAASPPARAAFNCTFADDAASHGGSVFSNSSTEGARLTICSTSPFDSLIQLALGPGLELRAAASHCLIACNEQALSERPVAT